MNNDSALPQEATTDDAEPHLHRVEEKVDTADAAIAELAKRVAEFDGHLTGLEGRDY
ncbi:hypothetical protein [Streptomyces sp. NBC_00063]|uniref:hypothetical protein n=1 Tax=Streptomyces sp. NBC_00063 TaxID=2975638 RepID=UPI003D73713C